MQGSFDYHGQRGGQSATGQFGWEQAYLGRLPAFLRFRLTFGPQATGTTSPPQTVTVTNTGTSGLSIATVNVAPADFKETDNCVRLYDSTHKFLHDFSNVDGERGGNAA